jgi:Na+/phosphate symporter
MSWLIPAIWVAGGLQLLVASANFFAPRKLNYRENLARLSPIVREIFLIQCLYIVLILVAFALLCFFFAEELAGASLLGRCLSGFLACFWGLRILMQLFHYNREIKREHPVFNAMFLAAFVALTIIFTLAAVR